MRRVLFAAVALVVALSCAAVARPAATFVLKGHGWGHGIGFAQYGAQGYADRGGRGYRWILRHYFPGTSIGSRRATRRVCLAFGSRSVPFGSASGFSAGGVAQPFGAGTWKVSANGDGRLKLVKGSSVRRVRNNRVFSPGGSPLALSGTRYRGKITLRLKGRRVWGLNTLGLDAYVRGVVPREMPSSWHLEALKAQAVAARTYSLATSGKCTWFGSRALYPTTSDQVYGGLDAETGRTNAAVAATARRVLLHNGAPAFTVFSSTSGGKTSSVLDEWGSNQSSYPYLVSVPDPYDRISPHHNWGPSDADDDCPNAGRDCIWSAGALKRALGGNAPSSIRDLRVTDRNGSRRVASARLVGPSGSATMTGGQLRAELGLRSSWFTVGVLRLTGGGTIAKGQRRTLHALARNLRGAELQRRVGDGAWTDMRAIKGAVNVSVRPRATTLYRLHAGRALTASIRVNVTGQPRFTAREGADAFAGVAAAGEPVQVQRRGQGGDWVTVAVALTREDGTWRTSLTLVPGTYRVYAASGGEIGTSPELTVVSG
jgi:stage II sporulation protein D